MSVNTDLQALIRNRIGPKKLIQMTNEDGNATSVNTTVLAAACDDTIGEFKRFTGTAIDVSYSSHVVIAMTGITAFLEQYKSRDSGVARSAMKDFVTSCYKYRSASWVTPLESQEYAQLPQHHPPRMRDSDPRQPIYSGNISGFTSDYNNQCGY
jgi:hypothetical protein